MRTILTMFSLLGAVACSTSPELGPGQLRGGPFVYPDFITVGATVGTFSGPNGSGPMLYLSFYDGPGLCRGAQDATGANVLLDLSIQGSGTAVESGTYSFDGIGLQSGLVSAMLFKPGERSTIWFIQSGTLTLTTVNAKEVIGRFEGTASVGDPATDVPIQGSFQAPNCTG